MGFFSWKTSDTNKSICNVYSNRDTFPVYVLAPNGDKIKEDGYEGYGVFGGNDIYALVAKWNMPEKCKDEHGDWLSDEEIRSNGLDLYFSGDPVKYGIKIVENKNLNYDDVNVSESCEYQGYFYDLFDL